MTEFLNLTVRDFRVHDSRLHSRCVGVYPLCNSPSSPFWPQATFTPSQLAAAEVAMT